MTPEDRSTAAFFASVATYFVATRDVEETVLDKRKAERLRRKLRKGFDAVLSRNPEPEGLQPALGGAVEPGDPEPGHSGSNRFEPYRNLEELTDVVFNHVVSFTGFLVTGLLEGREVAPYWDYLDYFPKPRWQLVSGRLIERFSADWSDYFIERLHRRGVEPLFELIRRTRPGFPFGQCRTCRKVFVRVGRQCYCSRSCTNRGTETARRESKREYMRKYMAQRRARDRRKRAKQN